MSINDSSSSSGEEYEISKILNSRESFKKKNGLFEVVTEYKGGMQIFFIRIRLFCHLLVIISCCKILRFELMFSVLNQGKKDAIFI